MLFRSSSGQIRDGCPHIMIIAVLLCWARAPRRDGHDGAAAPLLVCGLGWAAFGGGIAGPELGMAGIRAHTPLLSRSLLSLSRARAHARAGYLVLFIIWGGEMRGGNARLRQQAPSPAFPHTLH